MLKKKSVEKELITACRSKENIYIYGAGRNGEATYRYLEARGIEVRAFLVSDMAGNPDHRFGRKIIAIGDFQDRERGKNLIIVPTAREWDVYKEIYDTLVNYRIHNVYFFSKEMLAIVKEDGLLQKNRAFFHSALYHLGENISVEAEYGIFAMTGEEGEEYHWRFPVHMAKEQEAENIQALFEEKSAITEFEELYGKYHVLPTKEVKNINQGERYAVYMARSHVDRQTEIEEFPSWIIPIQVGAALTEADICEVKDSTGENISERNGNYSECTAIYWMWKNASRTDYIGLCHYRRHFAIEENAISELAVLDIDVLLTSPSFIAETVETFFSTLIPSSDIKAMMEAIKRVCPEYLPATERFLKGRFYPPCNIFVMKYDIFQEYGKFAFSVTFEIEHFYDEMGYYRKDRYMGFIMECLLGIFMVKNKDRLKIAYADMKFYL